MLLKLVLLLSILLRLIAVLAAVRLISLTGRRLAWAAIATGVGLMMIRPAVTLLGQLVGSPLTPTDPAAETEGLMISALMLGGILGIGSVFRDRRATEVALRLRLRQQAAVADLGQLALQRPKLQDLLEQAVADVQKVLRTDFSKVLELLPDGQSLLLRAGVGWQDGFVGHSKVNAGVESQAGYTLLSAQPVVVDDLSVEQRFGPPELLREHGVKSGMSVVIAGGEKPWGVLAAHSRRPRKFSETDVHFIQAVANVLAQAIRQREAEEALRSREEQFRLLIDNASDLILVLDSDTTIRYGSPSVERLLGFAPEEYIEHPIAEFVPGEELPKILEAVARGIAGATPQRLEHHICHKNGSWMQFESVGQALAGGAGVMVTSRDVSERNRLRAQLLQAQRLEAVGRLSGGLAHDFNNLLTVISGYSDLLLQQVRHEAGRDEVEEIQRAVRRATALTEQLLAFSRRQVLRPKVLNLNALVAELEKMLRRLIGEDVDLTTSLAPRLAQVRADRGQIEQVIANLAVNARDAMPRGGRLALETRNLEMSPQEALRHPGMRPGRYVLLQVSDTGEGMDEETLQQVFEPFFTTKHRGKGTGLGLSTSYGIVKQSGGYIYLDSHPGEGTTVRVYLPRVDEPVEAERLPDREAPAEGTERILLVEDEAAVRELARTILEFRGYSVATAGDGTEALEMAQCSAEPIDLLVTDVVIPGMSGLELAAAMKRQQAGVKVLFMSGYADDAIAPHGVIDPKSDFLEKPFTPEALAQKVRQVLDSRS